MHRSVLDFLVALITATLLIAPIRPASPCNESAFPPDGPTRPRGPDVAARQTFREGRLSEAPAGYLVRSTQSTELPRKTDPMTIAAASPHDLSANPNDPAYVVRVGPISDWNAAEIIRELAAAHYSPRMEDGQIERRRFRVVSTPMRRSAAEQLASTLANKDFPSLLRSLPDDQVEVQFGVFTTQGYAEDLANRLQSQGYTAAVVREAEVRIITVGPYSRPSVNVIVKVVESTMPSHSLTTVPCGSKDPLIHAWRGWVQVCRVYADGPEISGAARISTGGPHSRQDSPVSFGPDGLAMSHTNNGGAASGRP